MNGAEALIKILDQAGFELCFANPGTSEMHLVHELGKQSEIRAVLCLHENVVTGAADGYWRMSGKPAFTLLHVGSGFANGMANLHNAGRAPSALLNVVGANASYHQPNFPEHEFINGRISDLARVVSHWCTEAKSAPDLAAKCAQAVAIVNSFNGRIATLIAPTQCHWEAAGGPVAPPTPSPPLAVDDAVIKRVAAALSNGRRTALLVGTAALRDDMVEQLAAIAAHAGAFLIGQTFAARVSRGVGTVPLPLLPYLPELGLQMLSGVEQVITVGARVPVATFAYENKPLTKLPTGAEVIELASEEHDVPSAVVRLGERFDTGGRTVDRVPAVEAEPPSGKLTPQAVGRVMRLLMPAQSILVDEGATAGMEVTVETQYAARHDYLYAVSGGAIGAGLPISLGASMACPDRKVIALQADGSAMYTNQALWSLVREQCDVIVVLLKNNAYAILNIELARVTEDEPAAATRSLMSLADPAIDWVAMATAMGMHAVSADSAEAFYAAFAEAVTRTGPSLIEACIEQDIDSAVAVLRNSPAQRQG